jgi:hypothetical protein
MKQIDTDALTRDKSRYGEKKLNIFVARVLPKPIKNALKS